MSSNSTKTLQDFKDQIAQEYGYNNYDHFANCDTTDLKSSDHDDWEFHIDVIEQAAELYVIYKTEQAYRDGVVKGLSVASDQIWEQCCDLQKEADAEYVFKLEFEAGRSFDKDTILNAPRAINPHKKDEKPG